MTHDFNEAIRHNEQGETVHRVLLLGSVLKEEEEEGVEGNYVTEFRTEHNHP